MIDFIISFKSILENSPFASSTSNLELDDISEINLSNLLRSLKAIWINSSFSSSFSEVFNVSIALCKDVRGFLTSCATSGGTNYRHERT